MMAPVTQRVYQLADTLAELKVKVRAAMATELAGAVGNAVRDVLVVALVGRMVTVPRPTHSSSRSRDWREGEDHRGRDPWGDPTGPWAGDDLAPTQTRYELDEREDGNEKSPPAVPAAAAVAVGVNIGRWWFLKKGSIVAALGAGLLATTLGMVGGPVARAVLTVLTTATDVLAAESILARADT